MRRVLWSLRSAMEYVEYVEWVECAEYHRVPRSTWIAMEYAEHVECADHAECVECPEPPGVLRSTRERRASLGVLCARGVRGASRRAGSAVKSVVCVEYQGCCKAPGVPRNARSTMKYVERPKHLEYAECRRARGAP